MRNIKTRDIVICGILSALLIIVQVAFASLPNIEFVSFLIIIYTLFYRKKIIMILATFILVEGILYGFGLWWFTYLYVWAILSVVTYALRKMNSALGWAIVSGFFGLSFGLLCSFVYLLIGGWSMALSWWISGIPFDLIHCVSNFLVCLFLYRPVYSLFCKLEKIDSQ